MDEAELALPFFFSLFLFLSFFSLSPARLFWVLQSVPTAVSSHSLYSLIRVSRGSACEFVCTNLIRGSPWRSRGAHSAALGSLGHSLLLEWGPGTCARSRTASERVRRRVSVCVCVRVRACVPRVGAICGGETSQTQKEFLKQRRDGGSSAASSARAKLQPLLLIRGKTTKQ